MAEIEGVSDDGFAAGTRVARARVPVALTSRADSVRTRLASVAVMVLVAQDRRSRLLPKS